MYVLHYSGFLVHGSMRAPRQKRAEAGESQRGIARALGLARNTVAAYLRGAARIRIRPSSRAACTGTGAWPCNARDGPVATVDRADRRLAQRRSSATDA